MKKLFAKIAIVTAGITGVANAQQDPQFTQWMFNKLIYNAGYAGTSGAICGVAQYRNQWMGMEDSPVSIAFSADGRLSAVPVGIGINVISDKIGPMSTNYLRFAASYNLTRLAGGTLGIGLDFGMLQKSITSDWIVPEPLENDPRIPGRGGFNPATGGVTFDNPDLNKASFDLGAGLFYNIPGKFYAGASLAHIPGQTISESGLSYQVTRHFYFMSGYTFQLNKWSKITPNVFFKGDGASSSLDANLTFLWSDMVWIGGTYRVDDAPAILAGFQGQAGSGNSIGYKIGLSYDLTTSRLKAYTRGSFELVAGVCFTPKIKTETTYQTDRYLGDY